MFTVLLNCCKANKHDLYTHRSLAIHCYWITSPPLPPPPPTLSPLSPADPIELSRKCRSIRFKVGENSFSASETGKLSNNAQLIRDGRRVLSFSFILRLHSSQTSFLVIDPHLLLSLPHLLHMIAISREIFQQRLPQSSKPCLAKSTDLVALHLHFVSGITYLF